MAECIYTEKGRPEDHIVATSDSLVVVEDGEGKVPESRLA